MFKKILAATLFLGITAVLVWGGVNRTLAKTGSASDANAQTETRFYRGQAQDDASREELEGNLRQNESFTGGFGRNFSAGREKEDHQISSSAYGSSIPGELSAAEAAALLYMREEEKLAHDVYQALYDQWQMSIFLNISQSEATHTSAVKDLIVRYGLQDPSLADLGRFTNPELQALYNELTARGSRSLEEALKVGAAIEEIDILDLQKRIAQAENPDIQQVFNSLLNGSYNHLRSFVRILERQTGVAYTSQFLSPEEYQSIVSAGVNGSPTRGRSISRGNQGSGGRRGGDL